MGNLKAPTESGKTIARAASLAFGGRPSVDRYWDDRHRACIDIVSCAGSPWTGVKSYSTVGISEIPLIKQGKELNVRAELAGACGERFPDFGKYLSTAGFFVINSGWFIAPGTIFPDILSMYEASPTMKHFLFLPPFLWDERLKPVEVETKTVAWLLAVPISQKEMLFAESNSVSALEDVFEGRQIDIFDLRRPSAV